MKMLYFRKIRFLLSQKYISNIFALLAIIIAIYSSCTQSAKIEKQNKFNNSISFEVNGINHKPLLKIVRTDSIKVNMRIDSTEFYDKDSKTIKYVDSLDMQGRLIINANLSIYNVGNSMAKVFFFLNSDSLTFNPILRSNVFDTLSGNIQKKEKPIPIEQQTEILAEDSIKYTLRSEIHRIGSQNKTILHFLVFYSNELGNFYDTYYWIEIDNIPLKATPIYYTASNLPTHIKLVSDVDPRKPKISKVKTSYFTYNLEQSKKLVKFLSKL